MNTALNGFILKRRHKLKKCRQANSKRKGFPSKDIPGSW